MGVLHFFGGNGHSAGRLRPARDALARMAAAATIEPFEIVEVPYPGFEGRPRARNAEAFLATLADAVELATARDDVVVYGTGIGALFALTLRVQRRLGIAPLVLQGPVLWGLERRWMPRLARAGLAPLVPRLLAWPRFQRRFARRQFVVPPPAEVHDAFFEGYRRCTATADLFRWCGPAWLRDLEAAGARHPDTLGGVEVWWGGRDGVVGPAELRWTEQALGVRWPERAFPAWGHYPMIDDPEGWVRAVASTFTAARAVMIDR